MWPTCLQHKVHHKFDWLILKRNELLLKIKNEINNICKMPSMWRQQSGEFIKLLVESRKIKRHILVKEMHIKKTNRIHKCYKVM